jgi:4Fe-4S single cluster domain of Ferredoxin I
MDQSIPVYSVADAECLRCAACSSLAPGIIAMGEKAAIIVRQPTTAAEVRAIEAALFNCTVLAIRKRSTTA